MSFLCYTLLTPYGKFCLCPFNTLLSPYRKVFCFFTTFFTAPYWSFAGESSAVRSSPLTGSILCMSFLCYTLLTTAPYWPLIGKSTSSVLCLLHFIDPSQICTTPYWPLTTKSSCFLFVLHFTDTLTGKTSSSVLSLQHLIDPYRIFFLCPSFKGMFLPLSFL